MLRVRDGQRILQFEGEEIGWSTSKRYNSERWIEFTLYRTTEGRQYVLSRVGLSKIYHMPDCRIAENSSLNESPIEDVRSEDVPCRDCRPDLDEFPFVSFEREKYWARVYSNASEVIDGLMKVDQHTGKKYMTAVARRLLEDAGQRDDDIYETENVEIVR